MTYLPFTLKTKMSVYGVDGNVCFAKNALHLILTRQAQPITNQQQNLQYVPCKPHLSYS